MSAFAALKQDPLSSLLGGSGGGNEEEDDQPVVYQPNSSDSDNSDQDDEVGERDVLPTRSQSVSVIPSPAPQQFRRPGVSLVFESNFTPNEDNFVIVHGPHKKLLIGLKQGEYIVVNGQAKLIIQRGAVLINNCHYHFAHPGQEYEIIAPQSQSLPVIASTQVLDRSCGIVDTKTEENEHLFHSDYKSVILLEEFATGLEDIGKYCPPLKRFFYNREVELAAGEANNQSVPIDKFEDHVDKNLINELPFEVVLENKGLTGLYLDRSWTNKINDIVSITTETNDFHSAVPPVTMIIGNKNSGKSTFSKSLLNAITGNKSIHNGSVSYLDLDPGQSEFSAPYCLSITSHTRPFFGMHIHNKDISDGELTEYYGFSTPQSQPTLYLSIIKRLWNFYLQNHQPKGNHLIINTPGWIKGLGKELLESITAFIQPTNLVYLNGSGSIENDDPTIENLTFRDLHVIPGMYQVSKYSPAQLRTFNKLKYFHSDAEKEDFFNFSKHILHTPPLRISYQSGSNDNKFVGVNAVSVINFDEPLQFNHKDLLLMLDTSIVGVYVVENEVFSAGHASLRESENLPLYVNSTEFFSEFVNHETSSATSSFQFMGLCMIHSINKHSEYFNVYFPNKGTISDIQAKITYGGYKLLFVKGDGDLPAPEILMPELVKNRLTSLRKSRKSKSAESGRKLPYVSFKAGSKVGGVWKIRRNIMRRSHR